MSTDPIFDEKNEVKSSTIKWGKIGDWFKGTLTDNTRLVPNRLSPDKGDQRVYEFKAHGGSFHNIVDKVVQKEPNEIVAGDYWSIYAGTILQNLLRNAKIGQVIGFRFTEEKKSEKKGYSPMKIIRVYLGEMDPNYHGESIGDEITNSDSDSDVFEA